MARTKKNPVKSPHMNNGKIKDPHLNKREYIRTVKPKKKEPKPLAKVSKVNKNNGNIPRKPHRYRPGTILILLKHKSLYYISNLDMSGLLRMECTYETRN